MSSSASPSALPLQSMQRDLLLVAKIEADIAARLAEQPDDAYPAALRERIKRWTEELYACHLLRLPSDVLVLILQQIPATEAWRMRPVCRAFKAAAESEALWKWHSERYVNSNVLVRTQPTWLAEFRAHHAAWRKLALNPGGLIAALEAALRWQAVNEVVWRPRRSEWLSAVKLSSSRVDQFVPLLLELELVILQKAFYAQWTEEHRVQWRKRAGQVAELFDLAPLLVQIEVHVLPELLMSSSMANAAGALFPYLRDQVRVAPQSVLMSTQV